MSSRRLWLAVAVLASAAVVASWVSWFAGGLTLADSVGSYLLTNSAIAVTFTCCGAVVLAAQPQHRIGWLLAIFGGCYTASVVCLGLQSGALALSAGWERAINLFGVTIWAIGPAVCLPLLLQLFPDGRPLSPRWRPLSLATLAMVVTPLALGLAPGTIETAPIADPSPVVPAPVGRLVGAVLPGLVLIDALLLVASLAVLVLRLRRAAGAERLQVLWLLWAATVFLVLNVQRVVTADGPIVFLLTVPLIPAAVTVAIVRHQLYDIRLIVNRSLVYGLLTAAGVLAYVGIVAGLTTLAQKRLDIAPVIAAAAVALAFAPARNALQVAVDRLLYGHRRNPARAAAYVGGQLGRSLEGVLRAVSESLRLPYVAVSSGGEVVASHGQPVDGCQAVALPTGEGQPAELRVGLRAGERRLSSADRRALELVAAPVATALLAVRLSAQLQTSRAHLVRTREEERRRMRRDLHDGLGTALTAVTLKADAAYNLRSADPPRSEQLLLELRADVAGAIAEVRRLVYELRPADLDELGLVSALRQRAQYAWRGDHTDVVVTVDAPRELPQLPAAVEVAAYRIATEAVTNVLRHSHARACQVKLWADAALHISVCDNGMDGQVGWTEGVGLRSMQERAAELGGTVTAGPTDRGGRVHARLPLVAT